MSTIFEAGMDIHLTQDKAGHLDYAEVMTHAMVLTGVDLDEAGQPP